MTDDTMQMHIKNYLDHIFFVAIVNVLVQVYIALIIYL